MMRRDGRGASADIARERAAALAPATGAGRAGRAGRARAEGPSRRAAASRMGRMLAATLLAACLVAPATAWGEPADDAAGAPAGVVDGQAALGVAPLTAVDGGVPLTLTGAAGERSVLVRVAVEAAEGAQLEDVGFAFDPALEERAVTAEAVWADGVLTIVASAGDADLGADAEGRLALGVLRPVVAPAGAAVTVTVEQARATDERYVETAASGAPAAGPVTLALTEGAAGGSEAGGSAGGGAGGAGAGATGPSAGAGVTGAAGAAADEAPYAPLQGTLLAPTGDSAPMLAVAMVVVVVLALVVLVVAWRRRR